MENRTFIPGSEWLFLKLYAGTKTLDDILKNELNVFIAEMMKNDVIDKWFFIRYSDSDFHIRLRLHLKETRNFNAVFLRFYEIFSPLINSGLLWNIQCDTYRQEIERYGANTMAIVENWFFIDSEFAIQLLNQLNVDNPEQHRWKLALVLVDSFLSAFSFDLQQRKDFLNKMAENSKKEFGFTRHQVSKQLNDKCRTYRKVVETTMLWENEETNITKLIKARSRSILPIAGELTAIENAGELLVPFKSLLTSMIHMSLNRWFRTKNRLHELVIYELLSRYYASETAKTKKPAKNETT